MMCDKRGRLPLQFSGGPNEGIDPPVHAGLLRAAIGLQLRQSAAGGGPALLASQQQILPRGANNLNPSQGRFGFQRNREADFATLERNDGELAGRLQDRELLPVDDAAAASLGDLPRPELA